MNKNLRLTSVALLIVSHLAGDMTWPQAYRIGNEWLITAGLGFSMAQMYLIATWAALAPGRLIVRVPWALFMSVLMWSALVLGESYRLTARERPVSGGQALVLGLDPARYPGDSSASVDCPLRLRLAIGGGRG